MARMREAWGDGDQVPGGLSGGRSGRGVWNAKAGAALVTVPTKGGSAPGGGADSVPGCVGDLPGGQGRRAAEIDVRWREARCQLREVVDPRRNTASPPGN